MSSCALISARGVSFFAVDSEVDATLAIDQLRARERGYPFPILIDGGGRIAKLLGAECALRT